MTTDTARWVDYERLGHHRAMLSDDLRTEAFREAINELVKPGDVVVDLGTGSGILALFAARTAARSVYAIERTGMAEPAREMLARSADGRAEVICSDSDDVELPTRCDVLISECLGYFALQENMISDVIAFRDRWLKPSGRVMPRDIRLYAAPVDDPEAFANVQCWDELGARYGADFTPLRTIASNSTHRHRFARESLLADAKELLTIDMEHDSQVQLDCELSWTAQRSGIWHGVCGFFTSALSDSVVLDTSPGVTTHWQQEFFPRDVATPVKRGDVLCFTVRATLHKARVEWDWELSVDGELSERHGMGRGVLTVE